MRGYLRGDGRKIKTACGRRGVRKTCRWHVFSSDLSGYAAVASILILKAFSCIVRADRVVRPYTRLPTMPFYNKRAGQSPAPTNGNKKPAALLARAVEDAGPYALFQQLEADRNGLLLLIPTTQNLCFSFALPCAILLDVKLCAKGGHLHV